MKDPQSKGKTLWEMLVERLHANSNGSGIAFSNPLALSVGSLVPIAYANGPQFTGYNFTVQEIREYTRHIGAKEFRFTDYVLRGVNVRRPDADDVVVTRLRVVPNQAGANDSLLLSLYDEFKFAETFLAVLKDTTGALTITEDAAGAEASFTRINHLLEPYQAAVLVVTETTPDGKAATEGVSAAKLEYWDYWRDADIGAGKTAQEFVFVEMNSENGWFQIWRGREFYPAT